MGDPGIVVVWICWVDLYAEDEKKLNPFFACKDCDIFNVEHVEPCH